MKKNLLIYLACLFISVCSAQQADSYRSLDPAVPISFGGDHIVYKGMTIKLGPRAFFIDGRLSDAEAAMHPYVFNSVNKAAGHLTNGTEESPMVLYIAPWVYWIDDPDDPAIRVPKNGSSPFGLEIECEWLKFFGLSDKAENVVLACNRGQTLGSRGNFTMFRFSGQGTSSENITFGNYCNVDLIYPLKPELGRPKRASAIVQAQLIMCNGDKIVARNTRFISRLNLCPFVGGKRVLFDSCHFECTDDALCATGVYLNCTFDFYSSKPFYATTGTGVALLNCTVNSLTRGKQYFTKGMGQVAVIDTRFESETMSYLGWREVIPEETRNYQYNITINGEKAFIGRNDPSATIDMTGKPVLGAYRFEYRGKVIYNTWNLLRGNDDWDPMKIKDIVMAAGKEYSEIPTQILINSSVGSDNERERSDMSAMSRMMNPSARILLETGKNTARLTAKVYRFSICEVKGVPISWSVDSGHRNLVILNISKDGASCEVTPVNNTDETTDVIVTASTEAGLQAACPVTIAPPKLPAPEFTSLPEIKNNKTGKLIVDYKLDMKYPDQSLVYWYRCTDASGSNPRQVAVSRFNKPLLEYELSSGDIGYFIMASVAPKHLRSDPGKPANAVFDKCISEKDVKGDRNILFTDFTSMPTSDQPDIIPGFWTLTMTDYSVNDLLSRGAGQRDAWYYGEGTEGASGQRGLIQGRNGRLLYTPVGTSFGDMKFKMTAAPTKSAGQGFSVAPLFMDVLIKFDNKCMTGYALRFIRTTKYHDAVDCMFVRYDNGKVTEISKPVSTTCYRTPCEISVEVKGNRIIAHAGTTAEYFKDPARPEVLTDVNIEAVVEPGNSGGFGIEYNGGAATVIKNISVEWK